MIEVGLQPFEITQFEFIFMLNCLRAFWLKGYQRESLRSTRTATTKTKAMQKSFFPYDSSWQPLQ